jgi:hypothetical protein
VREDFRREEVKVQVVVQKVNAGVGLWPSPGMQRTLGSPDRGQG